ncbi:helix-turn-helix transcriptional regulator [Maricaulis sp.]|uniref:helix-turn-helix transcriptional regulator n=1 Tax=Maricaulis sp. TaxID=1486257 RepID=UPI002B26B663|nr:helix-turn-helix transcriptional regulator [Maricaulis sp.]
MAGGDQSKPGDVTIWRNFLRRYRFTNNIKQAALADDLGVTQAMVSRWESGAVSPAAAMQDRIRALAGASEAMASPLVGWRQHVAAQPGMAAVVNADGVIETASRGLARELELPRGRIEGQGIGSLFAGDLVSLYNTLIAKGFFDGALESVESADVYCFARPRKNRDIGPVHGLHWPHRAEDNRVRWMLTGARISQTDFESLRRELGGQAELTAQD